MFFTVSLRVYMTDETSMDLTDGKLMAFISKLLDEKLTNKRRFIAFV